MSASNCYCQSQARFEDCCQPVIATQSAQTAEALMRSRYTAHVLADIDYLMATWQHSEGQAADTRQWVESHDWLGLQVLQCRKGGSTHKEGRVEFIAYYRPKGTQERRAHHELSDFAKVDGKWLYVEGQTPQSAPKKTGRNDPCPCGSGKKFKRCCA
ncbi:YchJ family protein [Pseudoteredinibacter isoporae]|uniref:YchJ family protein n=1 Tax=Pseudoteredinibacter isoporae TaxID=570281 RepID=UPI00333F6B57